MEAGPQEHAKAGRVDVQVDYEFPKEFGKVYFGQCLALEAIGCDREEYWVWCVGVSDVEFLSECCEEERVEFERLGEG